MIVPSLKLLRLLCWTWLVTLLLICLSCASLLFQRSQFAHAPAVCAFSLVRQFRLPQKNNCKPSSTANRCRRGTERSCDERNESRRSQAHHDQTRLVKSHARSGTQKRHSNRNARRMKREAGAALLGRSRRNNQRPSSSTSSSLLSSMCRCSR